jgi:hypothetical protein
MRIVTAQELEKWLASGKVLEQDARGPKVVALQTGIYLKIFYTRRNSLLARLFPYAKKFTHNVELLNNLGIPAPEIIEQFWLNKRTGLTGCTYRPLPGKALEQIYQESPNTIGTYIPTLARFIKTLHDKGIYFRSLHFGNIILTNDGQLGLIDVLDLHKSKKRLSSRLVKRNLNHLQKHLLRRKIHSFPMDDLIETYRSL